MDIAMALLYLDAFSGLSGDMVVGGLLALGVDPKRLKAQLRALSVAGYELRVARKTVGGIRACKFDVAVDPHAAESGAHRSLREICALLEQSDLAPPVRSMALRIFTRLAEAEGAVHGRAAEDVEFHEVGAVDSIVDIVGTAIGLAELRIDRVCVSSLPLGSGMVESRHGRIPVPAPATVELLAGFPVRFGDGEGELVTPTGAAIVAALAAPNAPVPPMRVDAVGYGAGARSLADRPNVLRLVLGTAARDATAEDLVVIETNIDDMNPEFFGYVLEKLFAAGAKDVWLAPAQMKKNRPATVLHVLAEPAARDVMTGIILRETTAIGVRSHLVQRLSLPRETVSAETEFGPIAVKIARAPDGSVNIAPEFEACRRVAGEKGVSLKTVYRAAAGAARMRPLEPGKKE